jgi:hypothetical protein
VFIGGWETAIDRNLSFVVNRMNERVLAGQSIETLLTVAMFVLMGITLERSKIADDLHHHGAAFSTSAVGPCPLLLGAFLGGATGIVGATVVTMGLLSCQPCCGRLFQELATGVIAAFQAPQQIIPPSVVDRAAGDVGDFQFPRQETRATLWLFDALTYLVHPRFCPLARYKRRCRLCIRFFMRHVFWRALLNPQSASGVRR